VSDSGDSLHLRTYGGDQRKKNAAVNQISNHPVMIKAVSKQPYDEDDRIEEENEGKGSDGGSETRLDTTAGNEFRDVLLLKHEDVMQN